MFSKRRNPDSKLFLQDREPSQNCKAARKVKESYGVKQISISVRSPDTNPIEMCDYSRMETTVGWKRKKYHTRNI